MVQRHDVRFECEGETLAGWLFVPDAQGPRPALLLDGPLTSVKEQATGNHARALAERGFVTLAFDHRYFGQSGGAPRHYESPPKKIEDLRAAATFLAARPEVVRDRLGMVGVCAGAGYAAGAVATDGRLRAFGGVAGFYHDAAQQRAWMGASFDTALEEAVQARHRFEQHGEVQTIPAVGQGPGPVAMPLAEAFEYYGTPRGAVPNYENAFAVMSREFTLPYDAQQAATQIGVPTLLIHSEHALAPALARKFFEALGSEDKQLQFLASRGQIDFYDEPSLIGACADRLAAHFRRHLDA